MSETKEGAPSEKCVHCDKPTKNWRMCDKCIDNVTLISFHKKKDKYYGNDNGRFD